ncbi:uncharacterized protein LOC133118608 [Conger conger]|uniref:uncharacterized protein LOC133118608 n=1 Tax=Conger conger TaxID=82655 RepID=UPI002A5A2CFB|nr:uncharacterized protein LOC133118608 [Conger conger]
MEALKLETQQPELLGGASYVSAGHLSVSEGDECYADLLTSRVETAPQTRGLLGYSGRHRADGWLPDLEKAQSHLAQVLIQDNEVPSVVERTSSWPSIPDDAVSAESAPACVDTLAPAALSGGTPEGGKGPLGSWGTARLRCTPGREQVRLCELGSVKNGWLPIHKRALLFDVPLHVHDSDDPPSLEKMKAYIAATTPKGYTKKWNGNGHIDGTQVENCAQPKSFGALRSPSSPNVNQASSCWNRDRERNMYEEKTTCWPPHSGLVQSNNSLVDGGVALYQGSLPQRMSSASGSPCSKDTDPKNQPKTSFSSITITARRVPQTAGALSQEGPEPGFSTQARGPVTLGGDLLTQARSPGSQAGDLLTQTRVPVAQVGGLKTKASEAHPAPAGSSIQILTPLRTVAGGEHEPVVFRKKPVAIKVTEYQQSFHPGERAAASRPPVFRHSYSGHDHNTDALGFPGRLQDPRAQSVRSCAHLDLPARPTNSVLYLDKSLSVSLQEPESRREVHRSTLSLYLCGVAPEEASDGPRRSLSCSGRFVNPNTAPAELSAPGLKLPGKSDPSNVSDKPSRPNAHSCVLKPSLGDTRSCVLKPSLRDTRSCVLKPSLGDTRSCVLKPSLVDVRSYVLKPSLRDAPSCVLKSSLGDVHQLRPETDRHGGEPGEEARHLSGDFEMRHPVCNQPRERVVHKGLGMIFGRSPDPVIADIKQQWKTVPKSTTAQSSKTPSDSSVALGEDAGNHSNSPRIEGVVRRGPRRTVCENGPSRPASWTGSFPISQSSTSNSLTLREALELYRPDFISRSQGRVKKLEERAQKRRADLNSDAHLEPARGRRRRNCTKPHPLSDNLFKPRERSISQKDMQLRSKRIYNKLPEVTRKKEEEKKKVLCQTNRLRAEIFKKKLLDQILQRSGDRELHKS